MLIIDEAYIEFVREPDCPKSTDYLDSGKIIVGLRTFSKAYGLAGLRIGYGLMPSFLAEILNRVRQLFNVNSLAQAAAIDLENEVGLLTEDTFVLGLVKRSIVIEVSPEAEDAAGQAEREKITESGLIIPR